MKTVSLWTRRDPFTDFDALVRQAFGPSGAWPTVRPQAFTPAVEATRDGDDAVVRIELPGLDPEQDVTVEIDNGRLVVSGERRDARSEESVARTLREVRYGAFRRSFALPTHVTAEAVSAGYDAGILTVRVAGAYAGTRTQRIAVTTGTAPAIEVTAGTEATSAEASSPDVVKAA